MTFDAAARYPVPFGKHKGTSIRDLPESYIAWLARQSYGETRLAAKTYTAFMEYDPAAFCLEPGCKRTLEATANREECTITVEPCPVHPKGMKQIWTEVDADFNPPETRKAV